MQLYSLRDITPTSLEAALEAVSKLGYSHVEFAGFFGHSAEEVKAMLEKYGLYVSGSHVGSGTAPIKEVCDFAKENGVTVIIESEGLDPTGIDEASRCIEYLRNMK